LTRNYALGGVVTVVVVLVVLAIVSGGSETVDPKDAARDRAMQAQIESALKNAATAAETYAVDNNGDYSQADESDLIAMGLRLPPDITFAGLEMATDSYCLILEHQGLPKDHPWRVATYSSDVGTPTPEDRCR
jgi:type IV pilus assembly protein PilA